MTTYFFDRVGKGRSEYDYKGRAFQSLDKARQMAELIALDLGIEADGAWCGWRVDVLDARGTKFFSIPVGAPELAAA
jgi:Domain of unknown function (DUF6894)